MRRLTRIFNAAMAALICTLGVATVSILVIMFTTRDPGVRRTGLFGGVFFEAVDDEDGSLRLGIGVDNMLPLILIWASLTVMFFIVHVFYKKLSDYKKSLEPARDEEIRSY